MSQTTKNHQLLNWLKSEKQKDELQLNKEKEAFIKEIKNFKKGDFFRKPEKLSIWKKIKKVLGI